MICQKCGREAVVLLGGLCGPCSRGERYQRIGASAAAVMEDNDAELKRLRNLSTGVVAAAYERGAREFAEMLANTWPDRVLRLVCEEGSFNGRTVKREVVFDADVFLCRFLASRGTGIAESKAEEE